MCVVTEVWVVKDISFGGLLFCVGSLNLDTVRPNYTVNKRKRLPLLFQLLSACGEVGVRRILMPLFITTCVELYKVINKCDFQHFLCICIQVLAGGWCGVMQGGQCQQTYTGYAHRNITT